MEAYIVGGARTATGKYGGALASRTAVELATIAVKETLARTFIDPDGVDEVIVGNVLSAGLGQNPARQAALDAGIPKSVPSFTINKVCGSGLKSVALAGQAVASGDANVVIAGGTESMSGAPYLLNSARWGQRMGHGEMIDSMIQDALWDRFGNVHMGITAENVAEKHNITRREQDAFAAKSQQKAERAIRQGRLQQEIVPVSIKQSKGEEVLVDTDEHPRFGTTLGVLSKLKPAFKKDGTVTAGNASGINDGAGAVAVVSKRKMDALKPPWAFKILASHASGLDPAYMGLGPISASRKALEKAKCSVGDLDLIELNEAFASQSIQVHREMQWDTDKVNVLGGAIALGHPVGASGTRILITLLYEMVRRDVSLGLATLCIGGGQGIAMVVERVR